MNKKEQLENQQLKASIERLTRLVSLLERRVSLLERQTRTLKAKAHATSINISSLDRRTARSQG